MPWICVCRLASCAYTGHGPASRRSSVRGLQGLASKPTSQCAALSAQSMATSVLWHLAALTCGRQLNQDLEHEGVPVARVQEVAGRHQQEGDGLHAL